MDEKLMLEMVGYLGTLLVLFSFTRRDIKWLRIFNMMGGGISLIYAILVNTMPVVILNGSLILINGYQLLREIKNKKSAVGVNSDVLSAYDVEENTEEKKNEEQS